MPILLDPAIKITMVLFLFCSYQSQHAEREQGSVRLLSTSYENEFNVGVALNTSQVSGEIPEASSLISGHFNSVTPENLLKWEEGAVSGESAGLNPYIEELPDSIQQKLTQRYINLFKLFRRHSDKIDRVTSWGGMMVSHG